MRLGVENGPSFGQMIRAARLGWRWSAKHGALIRMTTDAARCYIQLWPGGQHVPDGRRGRTQEELHVVWWEDAGLLDKIDELRMVRRVKVPISFSVPLSREIGD